MMTEQEIVVAINTMTDNYGVGMTTDPNIVSDELRKAIVKLYNIAFEHGYKHAEAHGMASLEAAKSRQVTLERDIERLQYDLTAMRERTMIAEEKYRKAAETLRVAIDNMRAASDLLD